VVAGRRGRISNLLDEYVASDERGVERSFEGMLKERARQDVLLSRSGLSRDDVMLYGFDIELDVRPLSAPEPTPGAPPLAGGARPGSRRAWRLTLR
jgi:hypothetical protein